MPGEKELVVTLYTPHQAQQQLHKSRARFRVCCCGRRWGKTLAASNEMAKYTLEHPETEAMWVAPTYRQTQIAFRMMAKAMQDVLAGPANKSDMRLELMNGSVIQFASAERYDNLRGMGLHFLIMDETAQIDERAWTESLRATLSDTNGRAIFIGTPRGRNWFWDLFQLGIPTSSSYDEEWESFTFPTSSNPYIAPKEIASVRHRIPDDVFQQEYLAVFLEDSAGVFHNIEQCIEGIVEDPQPSHVYVVGWDVAKHTDFSVITVLDLNTHHVCSFERFNKIDYSYQVQMVTDIATRYHATVYMDATGNDALLEQVKLAKVSVVGVKFDNHKKEQYVRNLQVLLEHRGITYPYIPALIEELKRYSYRRTDDGNYKYGAPAGKHDDCVTSLYIAAWHIQESGDIPAAVSVSTTLATPPMRELEDTGMQIRQEQVAGVFEFLRDPIRAWVERHGLHD